MQVKCVCSPYLHIYLINFEKWINYNNIAFYDKPFCREKIHDCHQMEYGIIMYISVPIRYSPIQCRYPRAGEPFDTHVRKDCKTNCFAWPSDEKYKYIAFSADTLESERKTPTFTTAYLWLWKTAA